MSTLIQTNELVPAVSGEVLLIWFCLCLGVLCLLMVIMRRWGLLIVMFLSYFSTRLLWRIV